MTAESAAPAPEPRKPLSPEERPGPARESTAGAPSLLKLGGLSVRVATHTWGERKELLRLVADRTPQPLAEFQKRLDLLTDPDARKALVEHHMSPAYIAQKEWPPEWGSDAFLVAIMDHENLPDALAIMLRRFNPETSVALVRAHMDAIAAGDIDAAEADTFGKQVVEAVKRFLFGVHTATREQVRDSADPKGGEAGDPSGPGIPKGEAASEDTSPKPTGGGQTSSTE